MDPFLLVILLILGSTIASLVIQWIVQKIRSFLETKQYIKKLNEIGPGIDTVDVIDLNQRKARLSDDCSQLLERIRKKYRLFPEGEQAKPIKYYVELEATYRRGIRKPVETNRQRIRKPVKRKRRTKYWAYRRRY
jgi:hypothetical protein